jgi:hypothetical protein
MSDDRFDSDNETLTTADLIAPKPESGAETRQDSAPAIPLDSERAEPLFPTDEADHLRQSWSDIQAGFVDEPRRSVEAADGLVAAAIKRVAESFADERAQLEAQWDRGDDVSTEDLRVALRRYRSFFDRILSI